MLIDADLPRVLMARGLSRRQAAACLRTIEDDDLTGFAAGVSTLLAEALGTTRLKWGSWGQGISYDMPIGKGVMLEYHCDTIPSMRLILDEEIPSTMAIALVDRKVRELIEHDLLPSDRTIRQVDVGEGRTIVRIDCHPKDISSIIPASQRDLEIARYAWRRMRRRDAWSAGAVTGLTIRCGIRTGALFACMAAGGMAIAHLFGGMQDQTVVRTIAILGASALIPAALLWRDITREDTGLSQRITDLRWRRIVQRREAMMEGREPPAMTVP